MNSGSTQFVSFKKVGICEPKNQHRSWVEYFSGNGDLDTAMSMIIEANENLDAQSEDTSHGTLGPHDQYEQDANKYNSKVQRRLAQNREAARKSRLRKKAYVQQLESSRIKLAQLEQELQQARQQGLLIGSGLEASHLGISKPLNSGVAAFEMEYGLWVEEHNRQTCELRNSLNVQTSDVELGILVESTMCHYSELFRLKSTAAKADVVYLMSGVWKTSAERLFLWIGGNRPSELLKVFLPQLDPLTDEQIFDVYNLKQSCQQAEDALTQGMDRLQQTLFEAVAFSHPGEGSYIPQMSPAMERLESLVSFMIQADHLRHETLQQAFRILTTHQAARGLLALGEYLQRLRALSSLWATRPRK